jgi:hypothetical protein
MGCLRHFFVRCCCVSLLHFSVWYCAGIGRAYRSRNATRHATVIWESMPLMPTIASAPSPTGLATEAGIYGAVVGTPHNIVAAPRRNKQCQRRIWPTEPQLDLISWRWSASSDQGQNLWKFSFLLHTTPMFSIPHTRPSDKHLIIPSS